MQNQTSYSFDQKYANDEHQQKVISLDSGEHMVLAPPGCGKTDILAERVVRALSMGVPPEKMLCLTFTNRAARGMRDRILQRVGKDSDGSEFKVYVGNIHRFCAHYLFSNNILPPFATIIDEEDSFSIIEALAGFNQEDNDWEEDISVASSEYSWEVKAILTRAMEIQHTCYQVLTGCPSSMYLHTDTLKSLQQELKDRGIDFSPSNVNLVFQGQHPSFVYWDVVNEAFYPGNFGHVLQLAKLYEEYKQNHNLVDFDDLLVMAYAHASANQAELQRYSWIQIDEMQDLSHFQFGLVDLFTDKTQNHVTLYLGDEQQAIFSFMGAKLDNLDLLKQRCGQNLHHLYYNYRSPKYLLDVFNTYAKNMLQVDPSLLPTSTNDTQPQPNDLMIVSTDNRTDGYKKAAELAFNFNQDYPQERVAILVYSNQQANEISKAMDAIKLPHFKVSGTDLFTMKHTKLLLAHLSVLNSEYKTMDWCRLLTGVKIFSKASTARDFIAQLKSYALLPSDLLCYEGASYLIELQRCCQDTYVIFDTETTGLDVFSDDIVQIAAFKIQGREVVDKFNLILETNKEIPRFLGDLENPLLEVYSNSQHVPRQEGLQAFLKFVGNCPLIGHNVEYDYHILDHNLQRDCGFYNLSKQCPVYFDTLKITRLLKPNLKQYKLKALIEELKLHGQNSHLADDDIVATQSLLNYMLSEFELRKHGQESFLKQCADVAQKFRERYGAVYQDAKRRLYLRPQDVSQGVAAGTSWLPNCTAECYGDKALDVMNPQEPVLVSELRCFTQFCLDHGYFNDISRFNYIFDFLSKDVIKVDETPSLYEQLQAHMINLNTYREADLCDSSSIAEQVFVSTVHKAKGLEFETVVVFEPVSGLYPRRDATREQVRESARLLYVAMTRAKKRLIFTYTENFVSQYGNAYPQHLSPFLNGILSYFR